MVLNYEFSDFILEDKRTQINAFMEDYYLLNKIINTNKNDTILYKCLANIVVDDGNLDFLILDKARKVVSDSDIFPRSIYKLKESTDNEEIKICVVFMYNSTLNFGILNK